MKTIVVNKTRSRFDVDITRINYPYGNPFTIGVDGGRQECIEKYEQLWRERLARPGGAGAWWKGQLEALRGKRLGCVCRPRPCHGDVLVRLLEQVRSVVR